MGTIITLGLILFLAVYPVWMLVKLIRYGQGVFRPNFQRINRKMQEKSHGLSPDWTSGYGKFSYYFVLVWVMAEISAIIYAIINKSLVS